MTCRRRLTTSDVPQFLLSLTLAMPSGDPTTEEAVERLARAAAFKRDLLHRAGGALTTANVKELLGYKSPQAVHKAVAAGRLLAVDDNGTKLFPAFQFDGGSIVAGIAEVLAAAPDASPWALLQLFVDGDEDLGDDLPMYLVERGREDIARAARFACTLAD